MGISWVAEWLCLQEGRIHLHLISLSDCGILGCEQCSHVSRYQKFRGTCFLNLQGWRRVSYSRVIHMSGVDVNLHGVTSVTGREHHSQPAEVEYHLLSRSNYQCQNIIFTLPEFFSFVSQTWTFDSYQNLQLTFISHALEYCNITCMSFIWLNIAFFFSPDIVAFLR
jgi:hypothetical protein